MKHRSRGLSFVEILVAVAILGAALAPIIAVINTAYRKLADEKAEAAVAAFASSVLNRALYNQNYDEVVDIAETTEEIDGAAVKWKLEVKEVDGLNVRFQRIQYHDPCPGGAASGSAVLLAPENPPVSSVDVKYAGHVLKTLKLTLTWRAFNESWSDDIPGKTLVLVTRKARLK